ncbi:MAG: 16S rRNA processing protein RimM [Deltaproteobacteria bacterium]|nr:16S rRNA processing protein RimM [Deltaproteobacteria bacterium]MCW5802699.1 16S rRNA processing protein RimM [Deltaproteobacteria bacterium]
MRGDARIEIGVVARAHGIRGEVAIATHDPASQTLGAVGEVWVGGTSRRIVEARETPKGWLVAFEGVATRNDAETLRGQVVEVDRAQLDLEEGDILLADLVGCRVVRDDGSAWGTVAAIDSGDMQDRLVIHDGRVERLVPIVDALVTGIDLEAGVVTVAVPDGWPEDEIP